MRARVGEAEVLIFSDVAKVITPPAMIASSGSAVSVRLYPMGSSVGARNVAASQSVTIEWSEALATTGHKSDKMIRVYTRVADAFADAAADGLL